jgi:hypothetical protein
MDATLIALEWAATVALYIIPQAIMTMIIIIVMVAIICVNLKLIVSQHHLHLPLITSLTCQEV